MKKVVSSGIVRDGVWGIFAMHLSSRVFAEVVFKVIEMMMHAL